MLAAQECCRSLPPPPSLLRALNHGHPTPQVEDQGFHILIPTVLGLILLVLLGLVVRKVIQRRKGERPG